MGVLHEGLEPLFQIRLALCENRAPECRVSSPSHFSLQPNPFDITVRLERSGRSVAAQVPDKKRTESNR